MTNYPAYLPWPLNTVSPFSGIGASLAPPWISIPSPDKQDKEGYNIRALPVRSPGCKHNKSSINFGALLGMGCQANKHILSCEQ